MLYPPQGIKKKFIGTIINGDMVLTRTELPESTNTVNSIQASFTWVVT